MRSWPSAASVGPSVQGAACSLACSCVPGHYQFSDVEELLGASGFFQVAITSKLRASRKNEWCFKAVRQDDLQLVQAPIQWEPDAEEVE